MYGFALLPYKKSPLLIGLLLLLLFSKSATHPPHPPVNTPKETPASEPATSGQMIYGFQTEDIVVVEGRVKRKQRFIDLFEGYYLSPEIKRQIHLLPRKVFDFRKFVVRAKYTLLAYANPPHAVKALVYEPNPVDYIVFHLEDTLLVETCRREVDKVEKTVSGVVKSSLYETIQALDISPQLTNRFVDIFAWQIDFQRLQRGDFFSLMYEELTVDGNAIGIGAIQGAYFDHEGTGYCAFPFNQDAGKSYFDERGQSLEKTLLKYPIEFTRISSRYTRRRFHPVSRVFRPHLGTDFAAAKGTPIRSAGDGVVVEARYKVYNGNYVKIRHSNIYTTQYLHMSKIASGIRKGAKVRRGQTIGFVGKTGLATGPHLCYRFWKNNKQIDALKVKLPSKKSIDHDHLDAFFRQRDKTMAKFDSIFAVAR